MLAIVSPVVPHILVDDVDALYRDIGSRGVQPQGNPRILHGDDGRC